MRTTLDIDEDVLIAAKELGKREKKTAGEIITELARRALASPVASSKSKAGKHGFRPFAKRGSVVSNELIDRLRNESGT